MTNTNEWLDTTEIVAGLILAKRIKADAVNPLSLYPPYGEIIPVLKDGGTLEDVIEKCGLSLVLAAKQAALRVDGVVPLFSYIELAHRQAVRFTAGEELERIAGELKSGKNVDMSKVMEIAYNVDNDRDQFTPLSEVPPEKGTWIKTGYAPIDDYFGGIPKAQLTIIAASPGIGKTTLMLEIARSMVKKYKKKKVAIFSLEMLLGQIMDRYIDIFPDITKEERSRILAREEPDTATDVYARASRLASIENLALIAVDFADLMVEGEQSEAVMGVIYRMMAKLAKQTKVPVVLVAQLSRTTYLGGIPKINHIRYSGMAEMMASLILFVYNPLAILASFGQDDKLPPAHGRGYIIGGKSRFGWKKKKPGAVQVGWDEDRGAWSEDVFGWFDLT